MKDEHSIEPIPHWVDFARVCSQLALRYVGSPFLRFRLNGRDINVSKLEIGNSFSNGTIYINLTEDLDEVTMKGGEA